MKIECEVTGIESNGEFLTLRMQGTARRDAQWRSMGVFSVQVAETQSNCKAFHMSRRVMLTIEAK